MARKGGVVTQTVSKLSLTVTAVRRKVTHAGALVCLGRPRCNVRPGFGPMKSGRSSRSRPGICM
jgi:hypothetical protein